MQFDDAAGRWLQSVEHKLQDLSWEKFCQMVHARFGRNQHEVLIIQSFHIRQTGSVIEYVAQFVVLVDQLAAYTSVTDPLYFTMRFIDGVRDDIKSIVLVQRPPNLDTACTLALLQEEVVDSSYRHYRKLDASYTAKPMSQNPLPLPLPPRVDKAVFTGSADDRRALEASRASS